MRLVGLFVFLVAFAVRAQSGNNVDVFDPFFRYVEPRGRPSALPTQDESVDLFTGTLRINVVEFAFPGVAGLDLKLVRSYSSRIWSRVDGVTGAFTGDLEKSSLGIGWSMHFGRLRNPGASGQQQACGGGDYPVFEDGDGSARVFYPVGTDFISRDSWKMVRGCVLTGGGTGVCITDTQGRVREFSSSDQYSVGLSLVYPMNRIRDIHGNAIAATYNSGGKLNTISDTAQRTITFNYFNGSGCPTGGCLDFIEARKGSDARRVTYAYRVVTGAETYGPGRYLLQGPKAFLMRATPLVGPSLTYEYRINDPIVGNQFALRQVTNQFGASSIVEYGRRDVWTGAGSIPMAFVTHRAINGPSLPTSNWSYDYAHLPNTEFATTRVTRPDGLADTYNFYGFGSPELYGASGRVWKVGLQRSVTRAGGLETETLDWDPGAVVASANYSSPAYNSSCPAWAWDSQVRNPYVKTRTIVRDGSRYETTVNQVDAYGQPTLVTETGEAESASPKVRERSLAYDYRTVSNQIIGRVTRDESCLGTGCLASCPLSCAQTTRTFAAPNGLPDTETQKGVTTAFAYYADGSLKTVTDANAKAMTVVYVDGQPTTFSFGPTLSVSRSYEWDGQLRSATSARNNTTTYHHDAAGRIDQVTPPTGNDETIIAYDATGRVVTETRGAGASSLTTTRTLDGLGREIETSNSLGEHSSTEFDELGRTIFNALPRLTGEPELGVRTEYDGLGRAVKVTQRFVATGHRPLAGSCATPNACETTQVITQGHCVDSTVSRAVNDTARTTTCFESFGDPSAERVASITDAKSGAWSYKYDIADNLTDFTAAMPSGNRSFRFAPGTFFPVSETTQARGTSAATAHDRIGNPTTRSDARGIISTFEYDDPLS